MVKNILHCIDSRARKKDTNQLMSEVPLASYVTRYDNLTSEHATFLYLHSFHDDLEMSEFCIELFIRLLENQGILRDTILDTVEDKIRGWSPGHRLPFGTCSDDQADRLLAAARTKIQSQNFDQPSFQRCITILSAMWFHPRPDIQTSITDILREIVQRIEGDIRTGSTGWFEAAAWYWFQPVEFVPCEVFRDFFLWAETLSVDEPSSWTYVRRKIIEIAGLPFNFFEYAEGHRNMFSGHVPHETMPSRVLHGQGMNQSKSTALDAVHGQALASTPTPFSGQ
ncbi:hypothetical protein C8J56DRAFT_162095 [Mycena floridula]|nr:hypothetical protein C8J56DRAFT_162095 [Mycena floridula]